MEDSQVERQWTKFQHNFTSAYNFTPSELENLGKLGMDLGPRIVWDILFVTMILVGVAGNLMVLWIVTGTDQFFLFFKCTGKSFSEPVILVSTNSHYDKRLFMELRVQYMKIQA